MTDRNLFIRASEGDPEAEREVLARLRRRHPGPSLGNQVAHRLTPKAVNDFTRGYQYEAGAQMRRIRRICNDLGEVELAKWLSLCEVWCDPKAVNLNISPPPRSVELPVWAQVLIRPDR